MSDNSKPPGNDIDEFLGEQKNLLQEITKLYNEALEYVMSTDFAYQAALVVIIMVISHGLAKATSHISDFGNKTLRKIKENKLLPLFEVSLYFYFLILTSFAQSILTQHGLSERFLLIMLVMGFVWAVIRITFILITRSGEIRFPAMLIWLVLLLVLFGSNEAVEKYMTETTINIAGKKIAVFYIVQAIIVFVLFIWSAQILSKYLTRRIEKSETLSPSYQVLYTKLSKLLIFIFAAFIALSLIGVPIAAFAVFTGALGLGAGIGLQHILSNFISGFILLMDKSIKPGDTLEINGTRGTIDHMNARYVSMMTPEGKHILVPNDHIITEKVQNWSFDARRVQFRTKIGVSYNSDIRQVQEIVLEVLKKNTQVLINPEPTCLVTEFADSSVIFELRCWIYTNISLGRLRHSLMVEIWDAFKENNIELPFPQRDIHIRSYVDMPRSE